MRRSLLVFVLLAVTLGGCRRPMAAVRPEGFAPVRMLPLTASQASWAEELEPSENQIGLNLVSLYALDGFRAFLLGNLRVPGQVLRSTLLRTTDGGLTWDEVLPPYEHSEVVEVQFIECVGWALVGWVEEGPGELTLLGSGDCGERWHPLSELPKAHHTGWPIRMRFDDTFNGHVVLEYADEDLERGILQTHDGGRSWQETFTSAGADLPQRLERQVTASDGTEWKLDEEAARYVVRRRADRDARWEATADLPMFLMADGDRLVPKR